MQTEEQQLYVDVALPLAFDTTLTYSVPASLRERTVPGMRVLAPLQSRVVLGFLVGAGVDPPSIPVKPIIDLPDAEPVFDGAMLQLCKWIADYYCCSWGEALSAALPGAVKCSIRKRYCLTSEQVPEGRFSERQRTIMAALYRRGPSTAGQIAASAGGQALSNSLGALVKRGFIREEILFREESTPALMETRVRLVETAVPGNDALQALQRKAPRRAAVYLDLLYGEQEQAATSLYQKHRADKTVLDALEKEGLITRFQAEAYRRPEVKADALSENKFRLNAEQQRTLDAISGALDNHAYETFLIHGITGSGKTEVYLQAIEKVLSLNRSAIMLVPEIS
ncbi:MAG TPA: DEAD/DEAH box helicase family protein, partial [Candidatus Hydrogenedentes bacterium]|nr:DEAD/DEAH box helicase family protein [Candidatus Hydrogenedentota bacterium]